MNGHFVELAYRTGTIYPCCHCGWEGTSYQLSAIGCDQAIQAAEQEAAEHKIEHTSEPNHELA